MSEPAELKPFAVFLQEHKRGDLAEELAKKMQDVVLAVQQHQKKGSVTLKLDFSAGRDGTTIFVQDTVKHVIPEGDRGGTVMFPDKKGNLHRNDQNQMSFENLRVIEAPNDEPVVVNTDTGEVHKI